MSEKISNEAIEKQLQWRYATKRFNPAKKISSRDWKTLECSLINAPSSFGLEPWLFVEVSKPELRKELMTHSWNQPQVVDASHFIVLAAKTSIDAQYVESFIKRLATARNMPTAALEGYQGMIDGFLSGLSAPGAIESWCTQQTYIALGMLLSSAAMLGVDACPLEGIDRAAYSELLGLTPRGLSAKVAVALGYRADDDALALLPKVRFSADEIIERR